MKLNKLTTALAALAAAAVLGTSAQAQVYTTYSGGDALLGFEQNGNASNYLVDLGSVSQFIGQTAPVSIQLSAADLQAVFGSSWASNSQTNLVQWGIVANDQSDAISGTDPNGDQSTIWYTKGELAPGTQSTAPIRGFASGNNSISNPIQNLDSGSGGYDSELSTANADNAIIQTKTGANSWSSFGPGTTSAFSIGTSVEQPLTGSGTGPTDSVLDFYELPSQTASNQPAIFLGSFSLDSTGELTFDPAAVPEPSAYALGLTAIILFAVLKRRKSIATV